MGGFFQEQQQALLTAEIRHLKQEVEGSKRRARSLETKLQAFTAMKMDLQAQLSASKSRERDLFRENARVVEKANIDVKKNRYAKYRESAKCLKGSYAMEVSSVADPTQRLKEVWVLEVNSLAPLESYQSSS